VSLDSLRAGLPPPPTENGISPRYHVRDFFNWV
jgi:hypothetical protein